MRKKGGMAQLFCSTGPCSQQQPEGREGKVWLNIWKIHIQPLNCMSLKMQHCSCNVTGSILPWHTKLTSKNERQQLPHVLCTWDAAKTTVDSQLTCWHARTFCACVTGSYYLVVCMFYSIAEGFSHHCKSVDLICSLHKLCLIKECKLLNWCRLNLVERTYYWTN